MRSALRGIHPKNDPRPELVEGRSDALWLTRSPFGRIDWRPQHILDARRAGGEHGQPVDPESDARRLADPPEGVQQLLVERVALAIEPLLERLIGLEAGPLLDRIGQLAEAVGQLEARDIE